MAIDSRAAVQRVELHAPADERYADFPEFGESITLEEARNWLADRLSDRAAKRPEVRKLDRKSPTA